MRVTETMVQDGLLSGLSSNLSSLQQISQQISSSKRITVPSDDPAGAQSAVKLRDSLAEINQYLRNIDQATSTVSAEDTALGSAGDLLQRANELAIQGANGTLNSDDRAAMAQEVSQLTEGLAQVANTKVGDSYVFSGFRVDVAPYQVTGPGTVGAYQGDQGVIQARVAPGSTLQINLAGDAVFQPAFDALQQLQTDLQGGQAVQQTTITQIGSALQTLVSARTSVGARANRLTEVKTSQQAVVTSDQALQSDLEDVDMTTAITELSKRQLTYQASLGVAAKVMQTSLMDYLR